MIEEFHPYLKIKPTDVSWLPEIPAHWEVHRAKRSFREVDERSENGEEELLSVSHKTGVTPRSQKNVTMFMAESYEGHKLCRPGDIVVNTMWAWMAAIGSAARQASSVHRTGYIALGGLASSNRAISITFSGQRSTEPST
jgi:type I restriction enzyme, S subunit